MASKKRFLSRHKDGQHFPIGQKKKLPKLRTPATPYGPHAKHSVIKLVAQVSARSPSEAEGIINHELGWLQNRDIESAYTLQPRMLEKGLYEVVIDVKVARNASRARELLEQEMGYIQSKKVNIDFMAEVEKRFPKGGKINIYGGPHIATMSPKSTLQEDMILSKAKTGKTSRQIHEELNVMFPDRISHDEVLRVLRRLESKGKIKTFEHQRILHPM